jgi:hypothetical protein
MYIIVVVLLFHTTTEVYLVLFNITVTTTSYKGKGKFIPVQAVEDLRVARG